jgi:hypothetical protein
MSKKEKKPKLVGPWRNLHGAVWMIGLAILFWKGWFWPGILVLVAISAILESVLMMVAPQAFEDEEQPETAETPPQPAAAPQSPVLEHHAELLPTVCPRCGGPIRSHEVKWSGPQSADCPFCGANLPIGK